MGLTFELESSRAVTISYLRIASFSFSRLNSLTIKMDGYVNSEAYLNGAEPVDSFDVTYHNYDSAIKSQFYDLIEGLDFFKGAGKEIVDSRLPQGESVVTVVAVPSGKLLLREVLTQPEPEELPDPILFEERESN